MWQASMGAWCAAGACIAAILCALWLGTARLGARLLRHDRSSSRLLAPLLLAGIVGGVLGAAGHRLKAQADWCDEQGIAWGECRAARENLKEAAP